MARHNANPFGLTAAIFGHGHRRIARRPAAGRGRRGERRDRPTAHPATPFGGRGASGWGATQGDEGLLAMTVPQPVTVRRGRFRPHVDAHLANDPAAGDVARGILRLTHGRTVGERWRGLRQLVGGMMRTERKPFSREAGLRAEPRNCVPVGHDAPAPGRRLGSKTPPRG
ncbi:MAG: aldehyde dehydrogenase family protein [Gemmataceae bacterium]